ncbi:MAG: hypothetical protein A2Y40_00880 [Candidatus Margulisbacteria bacterium GWF2_35_9]|nr:MAG: hypothetical protein A2Y40_00880 [Candidatus Margulisbacteria bacterium GWF2_35_9]
MLSKLYKLGKLIPEDYFDDNPLGLNLKEQKDTGIVFLCFKIDENGTYQYIGNEIEDYDLGKNKKGLYLFKNASGNSKSPFATVFYEKNLLKDNCIVLTSKPGKKIEAIVKDNLETNNSIKGLSDILTTDFVSKPIEVKDNFILSIKVDGKYLGEWKEYKKIIDNYTKNQYRDFYIKYSETVSRSEKANCYICQSKDLEVWGYVDTFKFYSANEDSVVAGGFNRRNAWKNYPVCQSCAQDLVKYRAVIENNLSFNFYGFSYFLLPELIIDTKNNSEFMDILINDHYGLINLKKINETNKLEDELLDQLKDFNNSANFTMFFYEKNNSEFKIILSIENVFPSRFKELYEAKKYAENNKIFKDIIMKKETKDLFMSFGIIKDFFPASKIEGNFSSYFLELVRSIFIGKSIDYDFVMQRIMAKLRNKFINDEYLYINLLNAMILIKFINKLKLWNKKVQIKEREVVMGANKYVQFIEEKKEFFDSNTKKAVFLEGVLCQLLLNIQYSERNSTPFRSKLNGLKLDEKYVKKLLPEIINKLEEYGKNFYKELEETISTYMLESKWNISNDEISFFFVMGMNLAKEFKGDKEHIEEVN